MAVGFGRSQKRATVVCKNCGHQEGKPTHMQIGLWLVKMHENGFVSKRGTFAFSLIKLQFAYT